MQMSMMFFLPNILLSGFMFPFAGMPVWAQWIGEALPLTHYLRIVRAIMLKGATLADLHYDALALLGPDAGRDDDRGDALPPHAGWMMTLPLAASAGTGERGRTSSDRGDGRYLANFISVRARDHRDRTPADRDADRHVSSGQQCSSPRRPCTDSSTAHLEQAVRPLVHLHDLIRVHRHRKHRTHCHLATRRRHRQDLFRCPPLSRRLDQQHADVHASVSQNDPYRDDSGPQLRRPMFYFMFIILFDAAARFLASRLHGFVAAPVLPGGDLLHLIITRIEYPSQHRLSHSERDLFRSSFLAGASAHSCASRSWRALRHRPRATRSPILFSQHVCTSRRAAHDGVGYGGQLAPAGRSNIH